MNLDLADIVAPDGDMGYETLYFPLQILWRDLKPGLGWRMVRGRE